MRLVLVLLAFAALASVPVGAAPSPRMQLRVTAYDTRPGVVAETDLDLSVPASGGPVSVFVPAGYTVNLARRPGAVVGTATVVFGATRRSAELLATAGNAWAAPALQVAVAPDRLTFTLPRGVTKMDLHLLGVLTNPPSATVAVWRATAGALEARSIVPLPQRLGLRAVRTRDRVTLRGRLVAGGHARPGVNVHLALAPGDDLTKAREIGVATTRDDGSFALAYATKARSLTALAYVNAYVAACAAPCVSETVAPAPSEAVAVPFRP
jgi:hypothetical protein